MLDASDRDLDAERRGGLDVPAGWSCRTGVRHTCETSLVDGAVEYEPDPLDRPADGHALSCCARPSSDVTLDL